MDSLLIVFAGNSFITTLMDDFDSIYPKRERGYAFRNVNENFYIIFKK